MKRVRLLHAGALRLNCSFGALGLSASAGEQLRRAQQKVLEKLGQQAREWPADMIILCGSLFHALPVRADILSRTLDLLEEMAPTQICILPDEEEASHELSPWALARIPDNVTVFTESGWQAATHPHLPVCFHGKRMVDGEEAAHFFDGLSLSQGDHIHLALALCPQEALEVLPRIPAELACLAVGTSTPAQAMKAEDDRGICVASAPQGLSFEDCGEKYMNKVEITRGQDGHYRRSLDLIPSSSLIFEKRQLDAVDLMALEESNGEMLALPTTNLRRVLLHLEIQGKKNWRDIAHLATFTREFRKKVNYLQVDDHSQPDPADTALPGADTLTRDVAAQLLNRIKDSSTLEEKKRLEMSLHLLVKAVYESSSTWQAEEFGER